MRVKSLGPNPVGSRPDKKVDNIRNSSRTGLSKVHGGPKATSLLNIFVHSQQGVFMFEKARFILYG